MKWKASDSGAEVIIGVIPVDAIFSPVRRVNFVVSDTRVGQMTNYDKITLQIWTDGSINPDDALKQAAQVLVQHFQMIADHAEPTVESDTVGAGIQLPPGATTYQIPQRVFDTPIEELDLSVRAFNCLKRSGITRVGQVLMMSQDDLLAVRNFGEKSLNELKDTLIARHFLPEMGAEHQDNHSSATDGDLDLNLNDLNDSAEEDE